MQNFLRKIMQPLGRAVEKLGSLSSKQRSSPELPSPERREGAKPTAFPEAQIRKALEAIEIHEMLPLIPNVSGKSVLHATASNANLWDALAQKGAASIIDFNIGALEGSHGAHATKPLGLQRIKGHFLSSPFRDDSFDTLLLLGTGVRREDPASWIAEMTRILKEGCRMTLSLVHPYLEHLFNPHSGFQHGIGHYYEHFRKAGVYVEEIKEILAEEAARQFFGPVKNDKNFSQIKGMPIILLFKAVRLKRR